MALQFTGKQLVQLIVY